MLVVDGLWARDTVPVFVEDDGEGTLLVTESSIVNDNRDRGRSRDRIEDELIETLGVEKVVRPAGVRAPPTTSPADPPRGPPGAVSRRSRR